MCACACGNKLDLQRQVPPIQTARLCGSRVSRGVTVQIERHSQPVSATWSNITSFWQLKLVYMLCSVFSGEDSSQVVAEPGHPAIAELLRVASRKAELDWRESPVNLVRPANHISATTLTIALSSCMFADDFIVGIALGGSISCLSCNTQGVNPLLVL